jgi:subtilisin-like proprotein convertase family protein
VAGGTTGDAGEAGAGNAGGNTAGSTGTSGVSNEGGAGGQPPDCDDCDDQNPCTDDTCTADGCRHSSNAAECDDGDPCTTGDRCEGGGCQGGGPTCDDDNVCTIDSCDGDGECDYRAATGSAEDDDNQHIEDNDTLCGQAPTVDVRSTVTLADEGTVGALSVSVDLDHDFAGDLVIELMHAGITVALVNQSPNGSGKNGGDFDGVYTFRDGAPNLPVRADSATIPPWTYRPFEELSAFQGAPVAGEWTLRIADYCSGDDGDFSAFTVSVSAACSGPNACVGICSGGDCDCK